MNLRLQTLAPIALLAACTGTPGTLSPQARDAASGPVLELENCQNLGAVFPVPMDAARAALPPGFEPVVSSDPAGGATLYVLGLRCEQALVDGVEQGETLLTYAELAVLPPEDQAIDGLADYTVPLLFTAQPAAVGDALAAYRVGQAGAGSVTWEDLTPAAGTRITATLGDATITLTAVLAPAPSSGLGDGGFALFGVQNGAVQTRIGGEAFGGTSVPAVVQLEASGGPAPLQDARPAARGFSVSGFSLRFAPLP